MYTYDEIKAELLSQINQLLALEPKWKKCNKCPHFGLCCVGADISVYQYEWDKIKSYLLNNPAILSQVRRNYKAHSQCYFRISDRCLIHDIRPLNCIFTPYQAIYGSDKHIHYSPYRDNCRTKYYAIKCDGIDVSQLFIPLPTNHSYTHYLLLNHWYQTYEQKSFVAGTEQNLHTYLEPFLMAHSQL